MNKLRLSVELDMPTDFEAETEFRHRISEPVKAFRAALSEALGAEVGIRHEIVTPEPAEAPRRRRRSPAEMAAANGGSGAAAGAMMADAASAAEITIEPAPARAGRHRSAAE
jgi:hypothetical protein